MDLEIKVKGMAELEARLLELDALGGEKLIRRVLRNIAGPMAAEARENAALIGRSGALYKSVAIFNRKPKGSQVARVAVGSRAGNKIATRMHNDFYRRKRRGAFYGWMVDQGHATPKGRVRSEPWWTDAVRATEPKATASFVNELRKAVARLERRTSKTASPDSLVP